jgi:hypothetical protein
MRMSNENEMDKERRMQLLRHVFVDEPRMECERLYPKLKDLPGLTRFGIEPEYFYDYYRYAWNLMRGDWTYPLFCERVAESLGEGIRPYLGLLWAHIQNEHNSRREPDEDVWH